MRETAKEGSEKNWVQLGAANVADAYAYYHRALRRRWGIAATRGVVRLLLKRTEFVRTGRTGEHEPGGEGLGMDDAGGVGSPGAFLEGLVPDTGGDRFDF